MPRRSTLANTLDVGELDNQIAQIEDLVDIPSDDPAFRLLAGGIHSDQWKTGLYHRSRHD